MKSELDPQQIVFYNMAKPVSPYRAIRSISDIEDMTSAVGKAIQKKLPWQLEKEFASVEVHAKDGLLFELGLGKFQRQFLRMNGL